MKKIYFIPLFITLNLGANSPQTWAGISHLYQKEKITNSITNRTDTTPAAQKATKNRNQRNTNASSYKLERQF